MPLQGWRCYCGATRVALRLDKGGGFRSNSLQFSLLLRTLLLLRLLLLSIVMPPKRATVGKPSRRHLLQHHQMLSLHTMSMMMGLLVLKMLLSLTASPQAANQRRQKSAVI